MLNETVPENLYDRRFGEYILKRGGAEEVDIAIAALLEKLGDGTGSDIVHQWLDLVQQMFAYFPKLNDDNMCALRDELIRCNKIDKARFIAFILIKVSPRKAEHCYVAAHCYRKLHEYSKAAAFLLQGLELDKELIKEKSSSGTQYWLYERRAKYLYQLAELYMFLDEKEEAFYALIRSRENVFQSCYDKSDYQKKANQLNDIETLALQLR